MGCGWPTLSAPAIVEDSSWIVVGTQLRASPRDRQFFASGRIPSESHDCGEQERQIEFELGRHDQHMRSHPFEVFEKSGDDSVGLCRSCRLLASDAETVVDDDRQRRTIEVKHCPAPINGRCRKRDLSKCHLGHEMLV